MCSDSDLSWCTATDEYINLKSGSDEAINYGDAKANSHFATAEQQHMVNCDEYPAIRNGDRCANERAARARETKRWSPHSYTWKVPWILIICSAIQIVVHYTACSEIIDVLMFRPQMKYDLWRFFTYHIIHFEQTHLFLNVVLQLFVGLTLETEQGHLRILFVYVCGILAGAVGSMLVNPTQTIYGSSAAVYSLLFSNLSHCLLNWSSISMREFRMVAVLVLFGSDVLVSVLRHTQWIQSTPKVSLAAHFSGAIAGLISGLLVFAKYENQVTVAIFRAN